MTHKISKKEYSDKIAIWNLLSALDKKDYNYYNNISDEDKKKVSPYLLLKWLSCTSDDSDISKYYCVAANEFANGGFFSFYNHKELQWKILCTVSPNIGKQRHQWLGANKKSSPIKKLVMQYLPTKKKEDIELFISLHTTEDIKKWLIEQGAEEKQVNKL